jgi:hypothetical protein
MHSQFADNHSLEVEQAHLQGNSSFADIDNLVTKVPYSGSDITEFRSHFQDFMEMYAEASFVTAYLDAHQDWFCRCAQPMKVEPIGENAYALVIGSFGAFGYDVEPRIGLELLPSDNNIYRIQSIPVPNYIPPGYEIDFQASQSFVEVATSEYFSDISPKAVDFPEKITRVEWKLDLSVALQFPKFIHKLPHSLIQSTGDRLLSQVVRQVSRRLTHKVQEDFHSSLGLPMPKKLKKR